MIEQITAVIDDHRDYWPITPRQILYRLMGRGVAEKGDTGRIGEYLVRGRRGGQIPWEAIGDGRTESMVPVVCDDPEAFFAEMRASANVYRLDRQAGQLGYVELFIEAAGAVEQAFRTTGEYGVPVYSGSGFIPVTALRQVVLRAEARDVPTVILVAGDYDPAGRDIRNRVVDEMVAFAEHHDCAAIEVRTIALTLDQIDELGLAKQPMDRAKRDKYVDTGRWPHDWTVELEALPPDQLADIITTAIEDLTDEETRQAVLRREAGEREGLLRQMDDEAGPS